MATLGTTRLQAVNAMIAFVGEKLPHPSLDSSGSWPNKTYGNSLAGRAEEVLDLVTRRVLEEGTYANIIPFKEITVASSEIQFGTTAGTDANTLGVRGVGKDHFRNFTLRDDKLYDLDNDTDQFTDSTIHLELTKDVAFESMPTGVKEDIVRKAQTEFQAIWRNDQNIGEYLNTEANIKEGQRLLEEGRDTSAVQARSSVQSQRG